MWWWWWWCGGCLCCADMCDPVSTAAGVAVSHPFTINPPSTNSRIVCRRKDRGRGASDFACLVAACLWTGAI